jgi:hypothetical protein
MDQNPLLRIDELFETRFAPGCEYAWPLSGEIANRVFRNASSFTNFTQLIETWQFLSEETDNEIENYVQNNIDDLPEKNLETNLSQTEFFLIV